MFTSISRGALFLAGLPFTSTFSSKRIRLADRSDSGLETPCARTNGVTSISALSRPGGGGCSRATRCAVNESSSTTTIVDSPSASSAFSALTSTYRVVESHITVSVRRVESPTPPFLSPAKMRKAVGVTSTPGESNEYGVLLLTNASSKCIVLCTNVLLQPESMIVGTVASVPTVVDHRRGECRMYPRRLKIRCRWRRRRCGHRRSVR
eukprot:g65178.t1